MSKNHALDGGGGDEFTSRIQQGPPTRVKRLCVSRKAAIPSATHYVGYVEDEETPEMIMKKFEELDRVVATSQRTFGTTCPSKNFDLAPAACTPETGQPTPLSSTGAQVHSSSPPLPLAGPPLKPSPGTCDPCSTIREATACVSSCLSTHDTNCSNSNSGQDRNHSSSSMGLGEETLLAIFKATSTFSVRAALANNDMLYETGHNQHQNHHHHPRPATPATQWPHQQRPTLANSSRQASSSDDSGGCAHASHHGKGQFHHSNTDEGIFDDDYVEYLSGFWSDGDADGSQQAKPEQPRRRGPRKLQVITDTSAYFLKHEKPPKASGEAFKG